MRRIALPLIALSGIAMLLSGCAAQQAASVHTESDRDSQAFSTYLSARFAAGEHDLPQAARYYGQSLSNDQGNPSLLALSFFYSTTSGDFDAAGKYAQAVIAATPDDRAARLAARLSHDACSPRRRNGRRRSGGAIGPRRCRWRSVRICTVRSRRCRWRSVRICTVRSR